MKLTESRWGKKLVVGAVALSMMASTAAFASVSAYAADSGKETKTVTAQAQTKVKISWSKAKSIFKKRLPGGILKYMRLTYDDGRRIYKGKGVKGNYVYSFEISASTGKIIDWERDYEGSRYTASKIGSSFTLTEAKNKVKKRIPGCYIIYTKLTRDDGRYVYEGEAYKNGYEYSFEMNAYSGKWIEWERDWAF